MLPALFSALRRQKTLLVVGLPAALGLAAGGLAGCAATGGIAPAVTPAMLQRAGNVPLQTLNEGRQIFAGPCTACHRADPIEKYSAKEWRDIVDDMGERAKLDASRRAALLAYITAAHAKP